MNSTHAIRRDTPAIETRKRQVSHKSDTVLRICRTASVVLLVLGLFSIAALAEWQRDDKSLAWVSGTNVFWRFSFDPARGKPFFHPQKAWRQAELEVGQKEWLKNQ